MKEWFPEEDIEIIEEFIIPKYELREIKSVREVSEIIDATQEELRRECKGGLFKEV